MIDNKAVVNIPKVGQYIPVFQNRFDYVAGDIVSSSKAVLVNSGRNGITNLGGEKYLCQQMAAVPPLLLAYVDKDRNLVRTNQQGTVKVPLPTYVCDYSSSTDGVDEDQLHVGGSMFFKEGARTPTPEEDEELYPVQLLGTFDHTDSYQIDFVFRFNGGSHFELARNSPYGATGRLADGYKMYMDGSSLYRTLYLSIQVPEGSSGSAFCFREGNSVISIYGGNNGWNDNRFDDYVKNHPQIRNSWNRFTIKRMANNTVEFLINGDKVLDGHLGAESRYKNFTGNQVLVILDNGNGPLLQEFKITSI